MTDLLKTGLEYARHLDALDPLASYRERFVVAESDLVYMDGNSLGRLPCHVEERMRELVAQEWGQGLIRSWNSGWYEAPARVGETIAQIIGASPNQVIVADSTSVNLFKLVMAGLGLRENRTGIVTDSLNFPSDLYILQSCVRLLGDRHRLQVIPSADGMVVDQQTLLDAIDEQTALVCLSHVVFKSGHLYDAAAITEHAHRMGALVLWDLSHSVGVIPIELDAWDVDLAVGCTYKYLNGGPGSPAFLYVNKRLQEEAESPIWGWFGHRSPFAFDLGYQTPEGIGRFLSGTPPILSLLGMEAALEPILEVGIDRIHEKAMKLTSYLVELAEAILLPLGFEIASPRDPARRGAHISLRHQDAYRINRALIEEMSVLPDFREPDNLRLGLSPLYTSFQNVWTGIDRIRQVVAEGRHGLYSEDRLSVT